jgi:hypothetical protein
MSGISSQESGCLGIPRQKRKRKRTTFVYLASGEMSEFLMKIRSALKSYMSNEENEHLPLTTEKDWRSVYLSDMASPHITRATKKARKVRGMLSCSNYLYGVFYILYKLRWPQYLLKNFMMRNKSPNLNITEEDIQVDIDRLEYRLSKDDLETMASDWSQEIAIAEVMCYLKQRETKFNQVKK